MSLSTLLYAALGGILPPLLWLWFWLKEDKARPEPRGRIFLSFAAGMAMVPLVIPFEKAALNIFGMGTIAVIAWAIIEEVFKYIGAYFAALRSRYFDEPIDAMIYLITAALGFAAVENVFFLLGPLQDGDIFQSLITSNLRFLGATLLHTVSSAAVGSAIALSFYRRKKVRREYLLVGITLAVALHALFNLFIMKQTGVRMFFIFGFVWIAVIALIVFFEKVKRLRAAKTTK
jgi:RsiW-degrading membrane proteinase PrsW (M82 family)